MTTYIGSENIISPLGETAEQNFNKIKNGETGVQLHRSIGFGKEDLFLSKFPIKISFYNLLANCLKNIITAATEHIITSNDTIVFISTTKGDIEENLAEPINSSVEKLKKEFNLKHQPIVISNACISGVVAMNTANNYLKEGFCKYAFVIGADILSDFVLYGFQSLFAISDEPSRPFDEKRKGITLGEGAAGVLMSTERTIYQDSCLEFIEGTSSNDANHISGPSRTGEGLFRTVQNTLELSNTKPNEIDFISAHGTGTIFNDEMESIAFERLGMSKVPLNSLKGYFGHTLGAAGLIEIAICLQSLRHNFIVKSLGYKNQGVSGALTIATENKTQEMTTILKTASGFGGCNASALIRKLK